MRLMQTLLNGVKLGKPPWREAATLIVGTPGTATNGRGVEYLVTQRSPHSSVHPNGICFPGGAVSTADSSSGWIDLFSRIGVNLSSLSFLAPDAHRPPIYDDDRKTNEKNGESITFSKEIILRLTAIRETFEECGFLICKSLQEEADPGSISTLTSDEVRTWQKRIKKEPRDFLTLCQEMNVIPNLWCLREWSNWLTPTFFPPERRFYAMFYLAILKEPPRVIIDPHEVAHCFTATAGRILEGGWFLPPPQVYELSRMRRIPDLGTLDTLAKLRQSKGLERYFPVPIKAREGWVHTYPGDDLYPQNPDTHVNQPIYQESSTFAQLMESTKNHNRMHMHLDKMPEVIVNIPPMYGQAYGPP